MRTALSLLVLLMAGGALAEPDTFGLGNGRSGVGLISAPDTIVNRYGRLTASAVAGAKEITVSNATDFVVGELVLLHHSTGLTPVPASGSQRTITLGSGSVGRFEYARVALVTESTLKLTAALLNGYPANMTQVVSVPEYTELQVAAGASLKAAPWDGSVGGILAVLVSGTLTNEGLVTADGAGFRGVVFCVV
jgi:hypothetical protein